MSSVPSYLRWLQRLARHAPSELRFVALEAASEPSYRPLFEAEPERVLEQSCSLDMPAALDALAPQRSRTAGDRLRVLRTQLGATAAAGDSSLCAAPRCCYGAGPNAQESPSGQQDVASERLLGAI